MEPTINEDTKNGIYYLEMRHNELIPVISDLKLSQDFYEYTKEMLIFQFCNFVKAMHLKYKSNRKELT